MTSAFANIIASCPDGDFSLFKPLLYPLVISNALRRGFVEACDYKVGTHWQYRLTGKGRDLKAERMGQ